MIGSAESLGRNGAEDMTETRETGSSQADMPHQHRQPTPPELTGWAGWIFFAGIIMIIAGTFEAIAGLVALFNREYFFVPAEELVVRVSYTSWGLVHLIFGAVVMLAGFGVLTGKTWARIVGVVLAGFSAILQIAFLAAHPVWSVIVIALDVVVIYALCVHGKEMRTI
ncbi:MAG: DUF7144 family membrane protein [Pseudonocardiaceae bacterium]